MAPYTLPDLYRPWPPRLNPHVDGARTHTHAWAAEQGLVDAGIWDQATLAAIDLPLLAAYCFPEADPAALELVSDWFLWAFYLDDWFLEHYKRTGDAEGAAAWLAAVRRQLPADLPAEPPADAPADPPAPADPVQAALASLWARTVPGTSAQWRARFADDTLAQVSDAFWELENLRAGRVPNLIDYLEHKRGVGGGRFLADLIELTGHREIAADVVATRPVQVLRDTITDAQVLLNDLYSYEREIGAEGEVHNFVLVAQQALGVGPQRAADLTADLLTSRLHQFDSTTLTELPELFEERGLPLDQRTAVLELARGLQDANAGSHEWYLRSARYSNESTRGADPRVPLWRGPGGLGTSAARLWAGHRPVEPLRGGLVLPAASPVGAHPHQATAAAAARAWARRMGMLDGVVWSAATMPDCGEFAALAHPSTTPDRLSGLARWYTLLAYLSDRLDRLHRSRGDLAGGRAYLDRLSRLLSADPPLIPANPAELGLADLWAGTGRDLPAAFPAHFTALTQALGWALTAAARRRVPDVVDYLRTRRTEGAGVHADLVAYGLSRAEAAEEAGPAELFADVRTAQQDLAGYTAKAARPDGVDNGVLAVQRLLECDAQRAADVVADLRDARLAQFDRLDDGSEWAAALRAWLAGHDHWLRRSGRGVLTPAGPTGLGTKGVRAWI